MSCLIAFDLDDTLYKEWRYVASGRAAVAAAVAPYAGMDVSEAENIMRGSDDAFGALAAAIAGTAAAEMFPISHMVEIYRFHKPELTLDEGVAGVLEGLRRRGHRLMLITDGNHTRQHIKIEALDLYRFFNHDDIIVSDDCGSDKTSPVPFVVAEAKTCGMRRLYVGDNLAKDFHWPRLRGWHTAMLLDVRGENINPQHIAGTPPAFRPEFIIDNLSQLLKLTY